MFEFSDSRPKLFIGSATQSLKIARALHRQLQDDIEVTVWDQQIAEPSGFIIDILHREIRDRDFALFIFSGDDKVEIKNSKYWATRDNVVLETGLAIGLLGRSRVIILAPRSLRDAMRMPTDIQGLTILDWDDERSDGNIDAALAPAAETIRTYIVKEYASNRMISIDHRRIGYGYIESIVDLHPLVKTCLQPLAATWLTEWKNRMQSFQTAGLELAHGEDIEITKRLIDGAQSYVLLWQRIIDPYDVNEGWAGGWLRFLKSIAEISSLKKYSVCLYRNPMSPEMHAKAEAMERALTDLNFSNFRADLNEIENELGTTVPIQKDLELVGLEILKIVEPVGENYRSSDPVRLAIRHLTASDALRRFVAHTLEVSECPLRLPRST